MAEDLDRLTPRSRRRLGFGVPQLAKPWYDQVGSYELIFSAFGRDYTQKDTIDIEDVLLHLVPRLDQQCVQSAMVEY